ncbi:MvdC/MvdD family ATP grasp protein [Rhodococcus sp. UNC363MFTsu5.1]|uniref:MvdC/MvdD family ATP grasp protein n=1 Tax=Rhodococcus sp. UNC363MFTsu5.1 TaxID=1449069 RepID=UPI00055F1AD6|nr:ATP-dependent carboxylate-amine ligase [Rhodococcus sp. UNC363MFTsu5.1]
MPQPAAHILVLTQPGDAHADTVMGLLHAAGARVTVFDPVEFPSAAALSVRYATDGRRSRGLVRDGERVDLESIDAVWFRRPQDPRAHPTVTDPAVREYVEQECESFASGLWDDLDGLAVPGTRSAIRLAGRKPGQLGLAGRLGFELPPTIITTDPDEFLDFWDENEGRVITKPLQRPWLVRGDESHARMAELATTVDVASAEAMRLCPLIVQGYVPKRVELRVTVVGTTVFAAEIHSQESNHTRLDWRCYDPSATRYAVHDLPADVARRCVLLVGELGLRYGAIDLIVTPDGRYVFLEINPSGQWLWIEDATGLPISAELAALLLSSADRHLPQRTLGATS